MKMAATSRQENEMKMKYQKMKYDEKASPLERLRAHVLCRGVCSLKVLSQAFRRMDRNGDGRIDLKEFQSALHEEGIVADEATERKCFSQMDTSKSGDIDYEEFIAALKPHMSMNRRALVLQVFRKVDRDKSGVITIDDLRERLNPKKHLKYISGEWDEDQVLQNFLQSFSGPGKKFLRQITLEEFENYYAGVSASIELDCHFDLIMRQAWKL